MNKTTLFKRIPSRAKPAKALKVGLFLLLAVLLSVSCDVSKNDRDRITDQLKSYVDNPEKSMEELRKLHQLEYTVFTMPANSSPAKVAAQLNEHGRERWDCFQIQKLRVRVREDHEEEMLQFFCKRAPESLLRYIPANIF